ncbi:MAG: hypothetical protein ACOVLD_00285, partial [Bacteroidia bacterium]
MNQDYIVISDISFIAGIVVGFGNAITKIIGSRDVRYRSFNTQSQPIWALVGVSSGGSPGSAAGVGAAPALSIAQAGVNGTT